MPFAEKRGMQPFLVRVKNILLRPAGEWQIIKEEPTTYRSLLFGYVSILAALPPASAIAGRLIFDRGVVGSDVHNPLTYVVAVNVLWYFVIIANMVITGAVITAIVSSRESSWVGLRGLKLATYSFTPSFLVCILLIIPKLNWLIYGAILYSIYLLYLGIRSLTEVRTGRAAWYAVASLLAAGAIVGIVNLFEYMLESFIANKVFF